MGPRPGRLLCRGLALALPLALLAACTWSSTEPGLFPEPRPQHETPTPLPPPESTNPDLPVLGETVWTTGEGLQVTIRFAVHAVRRIDGATLLDWSVTPLSAPGFQVGDVLPSWVDLALTRERDSSPKITLIDPSAGLAYRPLGPRTPRPDTRCLCAPAWVAQFDLRLGETRLLQTGFPELPADVTQIDAYFGTLLPFVGLPVSPIGEAPVARTPTDLLRPAEPAMAVSVPLEVTPETAWNKPSRLAVTIVRIETSPGLTSVRWRLTSLTAQPSFSVVPYGPPITAKIPDGVGVFDPGSAHGLVLQSAGTTIRPRWMTTRVQDAGYFECLCSDLGVWAYSMRQRGSSIEVVTVYPALPVGTTQVDVVAPGAGTFSKVPVVAAAEATSRVAGSEPTPNTTWTYERLHPPKGWQTSEWPTPMPDRSQLADFAGIVEDLVSLPGR